MMIGSYAELSLSKPERQPKSYRRVLRWVMTLPERSRNGKPKHWRRWKQKNAMRVSELAAEYFERQILPRWKHPDILRRRIDKDINPCIGSMKVEDVKPRHIDDMLKGLLTVERRP
jgi:hypothetical protein